MKVAGKLVAETEAGWAARRKELNPKHWTEERLQAEMTRRKLEGNCLFVFAMVCKGWRKAQLKVGVYPRANSPESARAQGHPATPTGEHPMGGGGGGGGHGGHGAEGPGSYRGRAAGPGPGRDWERRAFTVGVGGPVGSGKTALMLQLCRALRGRLGLATVTNDMCVVVLPGCFRVCRWRRWHRA